MSAFCFFVTTVSHCDIIRIRELQKNPILSHTSDSWLPPVGKSSSYSWGGGRRGERWRSFRLVHLSGVAVSETARSLHSLRPRERPKDKGDNHCPE